MFMTCWQTYNQKWEYQDKGIFFVQINGEADKFILSSW